MRHKYKITLLALTMVLVSACNKKTPESKETTTKVGYVDTTIEEEHDCSKHEHDDAEHDHEHEHEHKENENTEDDYEPISKNGTAIRDVVGDFDEEDAKEAVGKPTTPIEAVEHEIVREQENKATQYKYDPNDIEENINWVLNRVEYTLVGDIREGELRNISAQTPFTDKLVGFLHSEFGTNPENNTNILELFNNVSQIDKFKTEIVPYVEDCSQYENTETMCNGGVSFPSTDVENQINNKMKQLLENLTPIGKQLIESDDLLYPLSMEVSDNIIDKDPRLIVKDDKLVMIKDDIELSNTIVGLEDAINYRGLMFTITSYDQFGDKILARRKDSKYSTEFEYNKVASNDQLIKYEIKNDDISIQVMVDFILNPDGTIKDITINRTR